MTTGMSLSDLISALESWRQEGELRYSTASNLRGACDRVLGMLEPDELDNVSCVDVDEAITRFQEANPDVSDSSVRMYKSRVEKAIELFEQYHEDPVNWKQAIKQRTPRSAPVPVYSNTVEYAIPDPTPTHPVANPNPRSSSYLSHSVTQEHGSVSQETLNFPFPLRPDVTVHISGLPRDLSASECERIIAFLKPLATDYRAHDH